MEAVLIASVVALVLGFVAGALLSTSLTSEARAVEARLKLVLLSVRNEAEQRRSELEAKRAQLEKDAKDSFEAVVKRIEALEQHVDQKICAVINPAGKS